MSKTRGRPTLFKEEYVDKIKYLMTQGYEIQEIANYLGIDRTTIYNWAKNDVRLFNAMESSRRYLNDRVKRSLFELATGYTTKETKVFLNPLTGDTVTEDIDKHHAPNINAIKYWLNNRNPEEWRERIETVNLNANVDVINAMTIEEKRQRLAQLMQAREPLSIEGTAPLIEDQVKP